MERFATEEQLTFTLAGRPLSRGKAMGHGVSGGITEFRQLIRLGAKMAMAEQGWKKTDKAVYMVIIIYLAAGQASRLHYKTEKERLKNKTIFATKAPNVERIATAIANSLKGIVYEQPRQIVGMTVVKKFSREPRVEVLIGKPKTFKELTYDLRNA